MNPIADHVERLLVIIRRKFLDFVTQDSSITQDQMMDKLMDWAINRAEFNGYSGQFYGSSANTHATSYRMMIEIKHDESGFSASTHLDTADVRMVFSAHTEPVKVA